MGNRVYVARIHSGTKSLALMDKFEEEDAEHNKLYDTLKLEEVFSLEYQNKDYDVSLYIERMSEGTEVIRNGLTFTKFKKELVGKYLSLKNKKDYAILSQLFAGISELHNSIGLGESIIYRFPVPIQFNAQNSKNRSGYGNVYYGEDLVFEGTLYGETTDYMFVAAEYKRWDE